MAILARMTEEEIMPVVGAFAAKPDTTQPVDLIHLSRQTLGNTELEQEILSLFLSQTVLYIKRLENAKTADERKMAAHTILGSARGLGAWQVAEEAKIIQAAAGNPVDISKLKAAVVEANAFIEELLA